MWRYCIFVFACSLWGAEAKLYMQMGHSSGINSVAFSPNGRLVVTGSSDRTARLWDATTGTELRTFSGHAERVVSVAFAPDGRTVLTGSWDNTARLWDVASGAELKKFAGHTEFVNAVAFSPDGRFVLTGSGDHTARLWSVATGVEIRRFTGHTNRVMAVAFSPNGRLVATGSVDETARIWDAATGAPVRRLDPHAGDDHIDRETRIEMGKGYEISAVAFSPDGGTVLTGSHDETARLWDVGTGNQIKVFQSHYSTDEMVMSVAFSPNGRYALIGSADGTAQVWDAGTGGEIRTIPEAPARYSVVTAAAFSPDGRFVLTASWEKYARLWDAATGKEVRQLKSLADWVNSAAISPDGRFLVTGSQSKTAQLWDVAAGAESRRMESPFTPTKSVVFSPDGRLVAAGGDGGVGWLWDLSTGKFVRGFVGRGATTRVAYSPDGKFLLTVGDHDSARLWDAASEKELRHFGEIRRLSDTGPYTTSAAFSPDGRFVVTGTSKGDVARLWDAATGAEVRRFGSDSDRETLCVAFSPDGRYVLTGSGDKTARLWDVATGAEVRRFVGHTSSIQSEAFSPDGRWVLTGSNDLTVRLWDVATGAQLRQFNGHSDSILSVGFSPDGRLVLTGSWDATTRLWEAASGKLLATLVSFREQGWVVVDPDGRFDISDLDGGAPLHWEIDTEPMRALPLEIFMRDYYTPRLLSRIVNREALPAVRSISEIKNRVQPDVEIESISSSRTHAGRVDVVVRVASHVDGTNPPSGLQDLRLFRNGQLVANTPLDHALKDGDFEFDGIQLPKSMKSVRFTAYAFNSERIKSATAEKEFTYEPGPAVKPRAWLLQIGVNHYQASGCELHGSVTDAEELSRVLAERLRGRGVDVQTPVVLVSDGVREGATKAGIRAGLAEIAAKATPDDLLFLSFSGHGYGDKDGQFYIFPADVAGSCASVDARMLKNAISADELAEWLRPIDAGEMTFVLDSCQSASSVASNDFKPGPMGSRGLGQLAYDKRMRILAASQSQQEAQERKLPSPSGTGAERTQGLLSYFLTEEGLVAGQADWKPVDGKITVGEWLAYAADAVPRSLEAGGVSTGRGFLHVAPTAEKVGAAQIPAVFDFSKKDVFVLQEKEGAAAH